LQQDYGFYMPRPRKHIHRIPCIFIHNNCITETEPSALSLGQIYSFNHCSSVKSGFPPVIRFSFESESNVRIRMSIVSTYSEVFIISELASMLQRNWSPVKGRGISASIGSASWSEPPKAPCAIDANFNKSATTGGSYR